jgi:hypothetical protein
LAPVRFIARFALAYQENQMSVRRANLGVETLEAREVPARFGMGIGMGMGLGELINAHQAKFDNDLVVLGPTVQKDQQAVQTAIANAIANDPSVKAAIATLKADQATLFTTIQADVKAVQAATTQAARMTAITQLRTDLITGIAVIQTDILAAQAAIQTDPGVLAAEAQLQADSNPLTIDLLTLQHDHMLQNEQ